jgi:hypothetical protein
MPRNSWAIGAPNLREVLGIDDSRQLHMSGESIARADRAVRSRHSGQAVRPSLGAVQYSDNLNDVPFDPIGDNIRRVRDDEFARIGHATRSAEGR